MGSTAAAARAGGHLLACFEHGKGGVRGNLVLGVARKILRSFAQSPGCVRIQTHSPQTAPPRETRSTANRRSEGDRGLGRPV